MVHLITSRFIACSRALTPTVARCLSTYKPSMEEIKNLRTASEAPLKDVKKALVATEGDFPAAFEWLRKKGIASATAKAGRTTAEGLIGVSIQNDGKTGALVEINSETDFVAMNQKFQQLVKQVSTAVAATESSSERLLLDTQSLSEILIPSNEDGTVATVATRVPDLIGVVGENVVASRAVQLSVQNGLISSYLHNAIDATSGLGRAAALVALEYPRDSLSSEQQAEVQKMGHRLAMHIVAARPTYLSRETIPEAVLEKERAFVSEQVAGSKKPPHIIEKMTEGRLNKFFGEVTLMEQDHFIEEGSPKVTKVINELEKKVGVTIKVSAYERYAIGEQTA